MTAGCVKKLLHLLSDLGQAADCGGGYLFSSSAPPPSFCPISGSEDGNREEEESGYLRKPGAKELQQDGDILSCVLCVPELGLPVNGAESDMSTQVSGSLGPVLPMIDRFYMLLDNEVNK